MHIKEITMTATEIQMAANRKPNSHLTESSAHVAHAAMSQTVHNKRHKRCSSTFYRQLTADQARIEKSNGIVYFLLINQHGTMLNNCYITNQLTFQALSSLAFLV